MARAPGAGAGGPPSMFDLDHPFFKPLWVRILVTALTLGWSVVEALTGSAFWFALLAGVGAWLAYSFFLARKDDGDDSSER